MAIIKYNGETIAGGGTSIVKMTKAQYRANKQTLDASDLLIEIIDEEGSLSADMVDFTPPTGMSATNVQGAIEEIDEKLKPESFSLTLNTSLFSDVRFVYTPNCVYIPETGKVLIDCAFYSPSGTIETSYPSEKPIAVIPQKYRPKNTYYTGAIVSSSVTVDVIQYEGVMISPSGNIMLSYYYTANNRTLVECHAEYYI